MGLTSDSRSPLHALSTELIPRLIGSGASPVGPSRRLVFTGLSLKPVIISVPGGCQKNAELTKDE